MAMSDPSPASPGAAAAPGDASAPSASTPPARQGEPTRAEVDAWPGLVLLEFGSSWCGHCAAARPLVDQALAAQPQVRHHWVEDGRGRPLGRSYGVKLWPTLVFLRDGREAARLVRPRMQVEIDQALQQLLAGAG